MATKPTIITRQDTLESYVSQVLQAEAVAIDTEFVWERTYAPRLGLVQCSVPDGTCTLIDTVACTDLSPFGPVLQAPGVVKILHDAEQDLTILRRATGATPVTVFDTQLAAAFAGMSAGLSLLALHEELLAITMQKGAQRSNWVKRPLTAEQILYACNDVRHLHRLRECLLIAVDQASNTDRLREELALFDDPSRYAEPCPQQEYRRVKRSQGLPPQGLAVLQALAAWRDQAARRADRPRAWVAPDTDLVELAARQPDTADAVARIAPRLRRSARDIAAAIQQGLATPKADWPQPPARISKALRNRTSDALAAIADRATAAGIAPQLITNRANLTAYLRDPQSRPHLCTGWRAPFLGE